MDKNKQLKAEPFENLNPKCLVLKYLMNLNIPYSDPHFTNFHKILSIKLTIFLGLFV